jgi:peptidylprolyl isomerase
MAQAKDGDKVTVHYTGKLSDGTVFDSTEGEEPLVFTLGELDFIDGFVDGILGMSVGEKKTVTLSPEQAYGDRSEEMVMDLPREGFPPDLDIEIGFELEVTDENDESMLVTVVNIDDQNVTLDGNPPLAGKTLTFDLELLKIG